jgi:magnesium-transporting ATPase (P-type)
MEKDSNKQHLQSAYKRIEQLKSFYVHIAAYCVVNISLLIYWYFESFMPETFWRTTFLVATVISGFILAAHAIFLFGPQYLLPKGWEEKKLKKLMEKEEQKNKYE